MTYSVYNCLSGKLPDQGHLLGFELQNTNYGNYVVSPHVYGDISFFAVQIILS